MIKLIENFSLNNIRGDIFGGLTAAIVALPLALAMGVSSGAGPTAGLYGAIFVGFFAALFGGTGSQISGPTGPMTVIMTVIFTQYTTMYADNISYGVTVAFSIVVLGGAFQILFGILKVGRYINLVPHPVISGFMSGIGIIIIILQLGPLFGHKISGKPLELVAKLPEVINNPVYDALILGLTTLLVVYFLPKKINKYIPSPLMSLIIGTLVWLYFMSDNHNVTILGDIPVGIPNPNLPIFPIELLPDILKSALILAVLGSIDSLLTSLVADDITRTNHKSDRELIGQGIGNMVAGIFNGLPGAGATMRTVVNIRSGGLTPISGMVHALILLVIVLGASSFVKYIPHAVLAGILFKVGTDIIDWSYIKNIKKAPLAGISIMLTVLFMTIFVDLIAAVATGVIMSSIIFMNRMSKVQLASILATKDVGYAQHLSKRFQDILTNDNALLYKLNGPMSFASAKGLIKDFNKYNDYDKVIFDLSNVPIIDYTTSRSILEICRIVDEKGKSIIILDANNKVKKFLDNIGISADKFEENNN